MIRPQNALKTHQQQRLNSRKCQRIMERGRESNPPHIFTSKLESLTSSYKLLFSIKDEYNNKYTKCDLFSNIYMHNKTRTQKHRHTRSYTTLQLPAFGRDQPEPSQNCDSRLQVGKEWNHDCDPTPQDLVADELADETFRILLTDSVILKTCGRQLCSSSLA